MLKIIKGVARKDKNFTRWLPINQQWSAKVNLLKTLVQRDLEARYQGSILGNLWPIVTQLLQLLIFTYVFSHILEQKFSSIESASSNLNYGLWMFASLNPWIAVTSGFNQASRSVLSQPNLVKKVVFPLELLPLVPVCSAFIESSVGLMLLILIVGALTQTVHITLCLLPLIWLPQLLITAGLSYLAAGSTVFLRDVPQTLGLLTNLWFYMTPIIYPISLMPKQWQTWCFYLNPLALIAEIYRELILVGKVEHWEEWGIASVVCIVMFWVGLKYYQKVSPAFADVL